jgi:hypothetical protein
MKSASFSSGVGSCPALSVENTPSSPSVVFSSLLPAHCPFSFSCFCVSALHGQIRNQMKVIVLEAVKEA